MPISGILEAKVGMDTNNARDKSGSLAIEWFVPQKQFWTNQQWRLAINFET